MDTNDPEYRERFDTIGAELIALSESGQPADITFHDRKPALCVTVSPILGELVREGVVVGRLHEALAGLALSNGEHISVADVWTINPMPFGGLSEAALAKVNPSEGDEPLGPDGETLRSIVAETYHCDSPEEEERYLRRLLASLEY